jgi:hypothetical protein
MLVLFDQIEKRIKEMNFDIKKSSNIGEAEKQLQLSILKQLEKDLYTNKAKYKACLKRIQKA